MAEVLPSLTVSACLPACLPCQEFYIAGNPNAPKPHRGAVQPLTAPERLQFLASLRDACPSSKGAQGA